MPMSGQVDPVAQLPQDLLHDELYPQDSYSGKVYWADLPLRERTSWVNNQFNTEARRELKVLGSEFKRDPLQPIRDYFSLYVITGLGLFVEGYTLFSVGNLTSLFQAVFPSCWKNYTTCTFNWVSSVG